MQVRIHHADLINNRVENLIQEKLEKLDTFFERSVSAEVYLKEEPGEPKGKVIEVKLKVPRTSLFATDQSDSYEKALAGVIAKIRKQLIKHKESLNKHH